MEQSSLPPVQTNVPDNDPFSAWLATEIHVRLNRRIAAGQHPWKQLLQSASRETVRDVYQTLRAYTLLWTGKGGIISADTDQQVNTALELCGAAEEDLEKGLAFIREVEKGSHMRNDAVLGFRPEAIGILCGLCRAGIEVLDLRRRKEGEQEEEQEGVNEDGGGGGGEEQEQEPTEEEKEEEGGEGVSRERALEAAKELIDMVYRRVESQLKTSFQVLVYQHKTKTRRK